MRWIFLLACVSALLFTMPIEVKGFTCPTCPADLNCDGQVDSVDLNIVLACWNTNPKGACANADINGDGVINTIDLNIVLGFWGPCP